MTRLGNANNVQRGIRYLSKQLQDMTQINFMRNRKLMPEENVQDLTRKRWIRLTTFSMGGFITWQGSERQLSRQQENSWEGVSMDGTLSPRKEAEQKVYRKDQWDHCINGEQHPLGVPPEQFPVPVCWGRCLLSHYCQISRRWCVWNNIPVVEMTRTQRNLSCWRVRDPSTKSKDHMTD